MPDRGRVKERVGATGGSAMPDHLVPMGLGSLYGLFWLGVARLAVEMWRVSVRDRRVRREVVTRLWRWRDC